MASILPAERTGLPHWSISLFALLALWPSTCINAALRIIHGYCFSTNVLFPPASVANARRNGRQLLPAVLAYKRSIARARTARRRQMARLRSRKSATWPTPSPSTQTLSNPSPGKILNQVNRIQLFQIFCLILILSVATTSAYHSSFSRNPSPSPSHTIIFDEIGQMASSMTYIHIAIPLNISTFEHQINVFSSYLENFINLKTDKKNQILFTKTIRDLATFADSRLLMLAEKVKYIVCPFKI